MTLWTPEQLAALRRLYPTADKATVRREVGRTWLAIAHKAHALGLKRPAGRYDPNAGRMVRG